MFKATKNIVMILTNECVYMNIFVYMVKIVNVSIIRKSKCKLYHTQKTRTSINFEVITCYTL